MITAVHNGHPVIVDAVKVDAVVDRVFAWVIYTDGHKVPFALDNGHYMDARFDYVRADTLSDIVLLPDNTHHCQSIPDWAQVCRACTEEISYSLLQSVISKGV